MRLVCENSLVFKATKRAVALPSASPACENYGLTRQRNRFNISATWFAELQNSVHDIDLVTSGNVVPQDVLSILKSKLPPFKAAQDIADSLVTDSQRLRKSADVETRLTERRSPTFHTTRVSRDPSGGFVACTVWPESLESLSFVHPRFREHMLRRLV